MIDFLSSMKRHKYSYYSNLLNSDDLHINEENISQGTQDEFANSLPSQIELGSFQGKTKKKTQMQFHLTRRLDACFGMVKCEYGCHYRNRSETSNILGKGL